MNTTLRETVEVHTILDQPEYGYVGQRSFVLAAGIVNVAPVTGVIARPVFINIYAGGIPPGSSSVMSVSCIFFDRGDLLCSLRPRARSVQTYCVIGHRGLVLRADG